MDVIKRIDDLMNKHNWSDYKLATKSGLSTSTIANIHRRNTIPSIPTLEAICNAFGITLSQFFSENSNSDDNIPLSNEQLILFQLWINLTKEQKDLIISLIKEMR